MSSQHDRIELSVLRKALDRALSHLEQRQRFVELDADYYWYMLAHAKFNPAQQPVASDMTMGQLTFDLDTIDALASGAHEPTAVDLSALSSLLAYLAGATGSGAK